MPSTTAKRNAPLPATDLGWISQVNRQGTIDEHESHAGPREDQQLGFHAGSGDEPEGHPLAAPVRKMQSGALAVEAMLPAARRTPKQSRPRHRHVQLWVISAHRNKHARIYFASGPLEAIAVQRWFAKLHAEMISACQSSLACHSQCYRELQRGFPMVQPFTMGSTVLAAPRYIAVQTRRVLKPDDCNSEMSACVLEATAKFDISVGESEIRYEVVGQLPVEQVAMMPEPLGDQLCSQPSVTYVSSEASPKQLPRHRELPKSRLRPSLPAGVLRSTSAPATMRHRRPVDLAAKPQAGVQESGNKQKQEPIEVNLGRDTKRCDSHLSVVREVTVEDGSLPSMDSDSNSTKSSSRTSKCSQKLIEGLADTHVRQPACQSEVDLDQPVAAVATGGILDDDASGAAMLTAETREFPEQKHPSTSLKVAGGFDAVSREHPSGTSRECPHARARPASRSEAIATSGSGSADSELLGIAVARSFTCNSSSSSRARSRSRGRKGAEEHLRESSGGASPSCAGGSSSHSGRTESASASYTVKGSSVEYHLPGVGGGGRVHDLSVQATMPDALMLPPSRFQYHHSGSSSEARGAPNRYPRKTPRGRIPYGNRAQRWHMNAATTGTALSRHGEWEDSAARYMPRGAKHSKEQRFKRHGGGKRLRGPPRYYGSPTRGTTGRRRGRSRSLDTGSQQAGRSLLQEQASTGSGSGGTSDLALESRHLPNRPQDGHEAYSSGSCADASSTSNSSSIHFGATSFLASAPSSGGGQFDRFVPVELILPPGGTEQKRAKSESEHDTAWGDTDSDHEEGEEEEGGPAHGADELPPAMARERSSHSLGDISPRRNESEGGATTDEFSAVLNPLFLIRTEGPVWGALMRRAGFVQGLRKLLGLRQLAVVRLGVVQ